MRLRVGNERNAKKGSNMRSGHKYAKGMDAQKVRNSSRGKDLRIELVWLVSEQCQDL